MERDLISQSHSWEDLPVWPLRLEIDHPRFGTVAHIVLETGLWRRAVGGIRMLPDVTAEQVADLARAMTYKFAFLNMPFTGAKGGIVSSSAWFPDHKAEVLDYIGRSVGRLIRDGLYTPGPDLGVGLKDSWSILRGAGLSTPDRDPDTWTDATDSPGFATGLTVFIVGDEALTSLGMKTHGASIAVEGFGKVGAAAAKLFSDAGGKIVGVSTTAGALYSPHGLDVDSMLKSRARYGDEFVNHFSGADVIPTDALLTLPVDVLCPCAGQWTLGAHNVADLQCKVISSGSNCYIAPPMRESLYESNSILAMPDFVSSSGTVLASNLMGSLEVRFALIQSGFRGKVRSLLQQSQREEAPPALIARSIAARNLQWAADHEREAKRHESMYATANRIANFQRLPGRVRDSMARHFAGKWLSPRRATID